MRKSSPPALRTCVREFLETVGVLPQWIEASTAERPSRGHYEWGHWSDALRTRPMWAFGGPWRSLIADIKIANLLREVSELHRIKDQIIWEIVEQVYFRAERARNSSADAETTKTRIRSVFSWQRRHDVKKHSLIWFIDFAFALHAYDEYQGTRLSQENENFEDPIQMVPILAPRELGRKAESLEREMLHANFLPFYAKVSNLEAVQTVQIRMEAMKFCDMLQPPRVEMSMDVRETRGMPREEKAVDFTTPWLASLAHEQHNHRWIHLLTFLSRAKEEIQSPEPWDRFLAEICRAIISCTMVQIVMSDTPNAGYVADITHTTAVEQSDANLLVPSRRVGQKRKRLVPRQSFRKVLDSRLKQWESGFGIDEGESTIHAGSSADGPRRSRSRLTSNANQWQDTNTGYTQNDTQILLMAHKTICGVELSGFRLRSPVVCYQESTSRYKSKRENPQ